MIQPMLQAARRKLAASELYSYNQIRRDRWVRAQARALPRGTRVLDVGAGSCRYRGEFSHCEYLAQDFVALRGEQLRDGAYGTIDYVCDAAAIPVSDASFGAILCTEVLEHHPHPDRLVRELARVLAPGGRLILTAPLGSGIHQEPFHFYGGYTPYWYAKFLGEAGFADVRVEANEGSLRFFAQESIRFIHSTMPFRLPLPVLVAVLWLPFWLLLLPLLAGLIPIACKWLDRYDAERRFTVGYHVTAVRA